MYRLSVCTDTVFLDLPFEERVKKIADAGFMVEFWGWQGRNLEVITDDPQVELSSFSATQGGCIVHPDHMETYVADVPDRHEPDTGELNYRFVAEVLREVGYEGIVGVQKAVDLLRSVT